MIDRIHHFIVRNIAALITITASIVIVLVFYGTIFIHPQAYIFSDTGDGIKNYYCYEWHVHNDTLFIDYSGSNYPFGENHGYTDGNPLLSNLLRLLPVFNRYSIGVFNLSMLLSFVFCAFILFKIFKELKVTDVYAVIASVGLSFLCPQVFRLSGHFTLSYGFCIPLIIYLLLKFERHQNLSNFWISFSTLCFLFIHPYLGMITTSFLLFYWFIKVLADVKNFKKNIICLVFQAILPLAIYFIFTRITDTHSDRVAKPYGFFHSNSSIETVFISTHKPFRHFLSMIYKIKGQNYEGVAYVGITSVFFLFYILILAMFKIKTIPTYLREHPRARTYLWMTLSSVILLLFSMGYPFKLNMNWLLEYVPVLQQFRVPGRFAWVFYFIVTIAVTVFISKHFMVKANKLLRLVLCSAFLLLFLFEAIPFHISTSKQLFPKNCFNERYLDKELIEIIKLIKEKKPQSVIPLPFFHIGTDYFNIPGTDKIIKASLVTCYHSKTPLMANLTPRNSLTEAENLIQIVSNDLIEREIKSKIKKTSPFFILYSKEQLSDEEATLFAKGKMLLESQNYIVKEIRSEDLFSNSTHQKQHEFVQKRPGLILKDGFMLNEDSYFYFANYDSTENKAYQGIATGKVNTTLLSIVPSSLTKETTYEVSFWYKTKDRLDLDNILSVKEISQTNDTIVLSSKNIKGMINIQHQNILATLAFKTEHPENKIIITLNGISDREKVFYVDNLMVRAKNNDVYQLSYSAASKDSILKINNIDTHF